MNESAWWKMGMTVAGAILAWTPDAGAATRECTERLLPVALAPGRPANHQVFTKLCLPQGQTPATVQLLVHGITSSSAYWDFPDPTGHYSYVSAALDAGFATLAMDRIGAGASSRPLGAEVTLQSNAYVVHQVVQALRAGAFPGPAGAVHFQKVILVGHSYGSITSWYAATDYQDVDGVILSGVSHESGTDARVRVLGPLYPAALDPAFVGKVVDPLYQTMRPGTRYYASYEPGQVDPAVLALDERTKSTMVLTELSSFALTSQPLDIRVPVLLVNGSEDRVFCGASNCASAENLRAAEQPLLGPQVPCVDAYLLAGAGHALNTVLTAQDWFAVAQGWATQRIGASPLPAPGCAR